MMEQIWDGILERFGQDVILRGEEDAACKAIVQPLLDQKTQQEVPGPLGTGRKDLFRYIGPAGYPIGPDTIVEWNGQDYRVQSAHLLGEGVCPYWRAVLYPRDEVEL